MAHILGIIPTGVRYCKKVQTLSCMKNNTKNIQQNIDCAAKIKKQLEEDVFGQNNNIKKNTIEKIKKDLV